MFACRRSSRVPFPAPQKAPGYPPRSDLGAPSQGSPEPVGPQNPKNKIILIFLSQAAGSAASVRLGGGTGGTLAEGHEQCRRWAEQGSKEGPGEEIRGTLGRPDLCLTRACAPGSPPIRPPDQSPRQAAPSLPGPSFPSHHPLGPCSRGSSLLSPTRPPLTGILAAPGFQLGRSGSGAALPVWRAGLDRRK